MLKFRLAILVAGAALAIGSASVLAMTASFNHDNHGDLVSSAARTTCRTMATGERGECVSAIASGKDSAGSQENNNPDGARAKAVAACKQDSGDDATETAPAKGDKSGKATDHSEDRTEHKAVVACITGKTPSGASAGS
jgi:hypothetical protein